MKEAGLAARLHYDAYERRSGLVRFLAPATDPDAWATAEAVELGDAVDGAFEIAELGLDRLVATRAATRPHADAAPPRSTSPRRSSSAATAAPRR